MAKSENSAKCARTGSSVPESPCPARNRSVESRIAPTERNCDIRTAFVNANQDAGVGNLPLRRNQSAAEDRKACVAQLTLCREATGRKLTARCSRIRLKHE